MVNFQLSERQQLIRETVRKFAQQAIAPKIAEWDDQEYFPAELFREMGKLGLTGLTVPEEWGGAGLTYLDMVEAIMALAEIEPGIALSIAAHNSLATNHINLFGSTHQKQRWLIPLAKGEWIGAWALTEPDSGSDAASLRTRATRKGNTWILNGTKIFTTHGKSADLIIVFARTGNNKYDITAFGIERGTPGLRPGRKERKLGMRTSETTEVILENCEVPDEWRIGKIGEGFQQAMEVLDGGRIGIAALAVGTALGAYHHARQYATERQQFGKPIGLFQGIAFQLADMYTEIEVARLLTYRAAREKDEKGYAGKWASMAKLYASEMALRVTSAAIQIHGGYGFIREYPVEKFYRDARLLTIGEGTSEIQRLIIAKALLKEIGYSPSPTTQS